MTGTLASDRELAPVSARDRVGVAAAGRLRSAPSPAARPAAAARTGVRARLSRAGAVGMRSEAAGGTAAAGGVKARLGNGGSGGMGSVRSRLGGAR